MMRVLQDMRQRLSASLAEVFGRYFFRMKNRAVIIAVPGLMIVSIICAVCSVITQQAVVRGETLKRAEVVSNMISCIAQCNLTQRNTGQGREMLTLLREMPAVVSVSLYDDHNRLTQGEDDAADQRHPSPYQRKMTIFEDRDHYDIYTPVFSKGTSEDYDSAYTGSLPDRNDKPVGWIRTAVLRAYLKEDGTRLIFKGLLAAFFFTAGSSIVAFILFVFAVRSLTRISSAVRDIRNIHYPELPMRSHDGIEDIASEFERMSRAINKREAMLVVRARFSQFGSDIGIALTESANLTEMIGKCCEICRLYTDSICVAIWRYDMNDGLLHLQNMSGMFAGDPFPSVHLALGEASAGHIAMEMVPFATKNPSEIPWFRNGEFMVSHEVGFFAGYPIVVESRLIGVLELFARQPFCWDLLNTLDTLSDEMAVGFERKLIEERMRDSLEEKEVLLREIHHRVKNNMQVISSLLNLQSGTLADRRYREMFDDSKNRIRAMALVHEKLYQTQDIAKIDINDYISSLASGLFMFYGVSASHIELSIDAADIVLGIDTAIPCGLIINELLTNALKYAFPDGRKGMIRIAVKKDEGAINSGTMYTLSVKDNGIGLQEGFDFRDSKSLGLLLVTSLAEHQLQGSMNVTRQNGTEFHIIFRDAGDRKKV